MTQNRVSNGHVYLWSGGVLLGRVSGSAQQAEGLGCLQRPEDQAADLPGGLPAPAEPGLQGDSLFHPLLTSDRVEWSCVGNVAVDSAAPNKLVFLSDNCLQGDPLFYLLLASDRVEWSCVGNVAAGSAAPNKVLFFI